MLICHCNAVNDRAIRAAIAAGAREPAEITAGCGAGGRCGGCLPALVELLQERSGGDGQVVGVRGLALANT